MNKTFRSFIALFVLLSGLSANVHASSPNAQTLTGEEILEMNSPAKGDWPLIAARKKIRLIVGTDRVNYFYDGTQITGLAYEIAKELESFLNAKNAKGAANPRVSVIVFPTRRDKIFSDLNEGYGDVAAAGLTVTPERRAEADFSIPVMTGVKEIAVIRAGEPEMTSPESLSGRTVWVRRSSSYFQHLQDLNQRLKSAKRPPVKIHEADEALEDEDLLEMLNAGIIPATVVDDYRARFWAEVLSRIQLQPQAAIYSQGDIAWAVRRGSPELLKKINAFIKTRRAGTLYGNMLIKRYYQNTEWINNPAEAQEMKKFQAVMQLIKKYAADYQFDWLMIASQAYQESRLDPSAKSKRGAVGIMQVLPSTASDPRIAVSDVEDTENNIHAGVKYLRLLREDYFNAPDIDEVNQTLFSFAAYNAGPGNIKKLRKQASVMKLDPNQWFQNVEAAAAKSLGTETVRYVSNIYKYYLAYSMVFEGQAAKAGARNRMGE